MAKKSDTGANRRDFLKMAATAAPAAAAAAVIAQTPAAEAAEPETKASGDGCGGGDMPLGGALVAGLALAWRSRAGRRVRA